MKNTKYLYARIPGFPEKILVSTQEDATLLHSKEVLIKTQQGLFTGFVNSFPFEMAQQVSSARLMHLLTEENREEQLHNRTKTQEIRNQVRDLVLELNLAMEISHLMLSLDEKSCTIFYTAEARVDFRDLLKTLKNQFSFSIVMRQISSYERNLCYHADPHIPMHHDPKALENRESRYELFKLV
jgi:cell fate regulator YaaT (PSP1 superfamily)